MGLVRSYEESLSRTDPESYVTEYTSVYEDESLATHSRKPLGDAFGVSLTFNPSSPGATFGNIDLWVPLRRIWRGMSGGMGGG